MTAFADLAETKFSFTYNVDKSYQTANPRNVHFLGYYNVTGMPYKPVDTTIASAVYPERMPKDKFETAVRLVGQAYSCFEPTDGNKFFRAAKTLVEEMYGCSLNMIQEFTSEHPQFFNRCVDTSRTKGTRLRSVERGNVNHATFSTKKMVAKILELRRVDARC